MVSQLFRSIRISNFFSSLFFIGLSLSVLDAHAGNKNSKSVPRLVVSSPTDGASAEKGASFNLSGQAFDKRDGDISDKIKWYSSVDGFVASGASGSVVLSVGEHVLESRVTNSIGKSSVRSVTVNVIQQQNTAPAVTILSPTGGNTFEDGDIISLAGQASDAEDGDISNQIEWVSNIDGTLGSGSGVQATLSPGEHSLTAMVSDSSGASAHSIVNVSVSLVASSNTPPELTILSPDSGSRFNESDTITFSASAIDSEDGGISHSIQWISDIDGSLGNGSELIAALTLGTHVITAKITDSSGETVSQQLTLNVESLYGVATVAWTAPLQNTDGSSLSDLAGFKVYYGTSSNDLNSSVSINDPVASSLFFDNLPTNQTVFFSVVAVNQSGSESEFSTVVSKYIEG